MTSPGAGFKIADAYVELSARTDKLDGQVSTSVTQATRKAEGAATKGGTSLGKSMAAGFAAAGVGAAAVAIFSTMISEAREAEKVTRSTAQGIKTMGAESWTSAQAVGDLAEAISNKIGVDDELIQQSANLLLTFGKVRNAVGENNNIFDRAVQTAQDLAAKGFGDADSAAKMLGKALNDPVAGMTALGKAGVTFDDAQKKQIKSMVVSNDLLGAQKLIMAEVEKQVGGTAEAVATAADKTSTKWGNTMEELGSKLLPVLDIGADVLSGMFNWDWMPAVNDAIGSFMENLFHTVTDWLGALPGVVSGFFADMASRIVGFLSGILTSIDQWAISVWVSVIGWLGQLPGRVWGFFRDMFVGVTGWIAGILTSVGAWGANLLGTVGGWFAALPGRAMDGMTGIFRGVVEWGSKIVGSAAQWGRGLVDTIGGWFSKIKDIAAIPIRWVVDKVWNGGILKAWNAVVGLWGGDQASPVVLGFHSGGRIPGNTSGDKVPIMAESQEFIVRRSIAQRTMGFLRALNAGQPEAMQAAGGSYQRFATGGSVAAAADFARRQAGKPYVWGGVGPEGYDCSGYIGAIQNAAFGRNPYSRVGSTRNMPWPGWVRGLGSAFGVGWTNAGVGHTAGTLAGVNVESSGSAGVRYGGGARGATNSMFGSAMSLPSLGGSFIAGIGGSGQGVGSLKGFIRDRVKELTDPLIDMLPGPPPRYREIPRGAARGARDGLLAAALSLVPFDQGGLADFGHGPEQVLSRGQTQAFNEAMTSGFVGGQHTWNISIPVADLAELRTVQDFFDRMRQTARSGSSRLAGVS